MILDSAMSSNKIYSSDAPAGKYYLWELFAGDTISTITITATND